MHALVHPNHPRPTPRRLGTNIVRSRPTCRCRHSYESTSRTPIRDVPSNQPRCRLPTGETSRIVDRSSMARKEECSAGACPPLGPGSGVAESAGPTRITRPQLRLFRPSCTRSSRHLRFVRKHVPGLRSGMCPPINLDAGSPPANPAEL